MLVTLLLLAILTIGAVSASEDAAISDDSDVLSQSPDDALTVEDSQEDLAENPAEETISGDDAENVLSYEASDFDVKINESMDLDDKDASAVTFEVPDGAEGKIWVYTNYTESIIGFDLDRSPLTLYDLWIDSPGLYSINVTFFSDESVETNLASGTINVTGTVKTFTPEDFNVKINENADLNHDDTAITFDVPEGADGEILVGVDTADERYIFDIDNSPITLDDLFIDETGTYTLYVFYRTTPVNEMELATGTIIVTRTINEDDFDSYEVYSNDGDPITDLSEDVFWLYESPVEGKLIVFVDNNNVYNVSVSVEEDVYISSEDLGINGESSPYHITVIFNTTEGEEFTLADFDAYYDITDSQEPYISIYSKIIREQIVPLAYISDDNSINGIVTLSIDGVTYYNKEFDGTDDYISIWPDDLEGIDVFSKDFLGNHTVNVTYNGLSEESEVAFIFEPYFVVFDAAVGEQSYILFKAPGNFIGYVDLYNTVYNESDERFEQDSLIFEHYLISSSSCRVPLPELTVGYHVFYLNYTIDDVSDYSFFRVYAGENAQNLSSSISSTSIVAGDSVTVTVTGPEEGWIDFFVDGDHEAVFSLANGTVEYTFSNLAIGSHVISLSYDGYGYNDLFCSKNFIVTVSETSGSNIVDVSVDSSTTIIYGELILTDIATGQVFKTNITRNPIKSAMTNPGNYSSNVNEIINQLLNLAQTHAGDKTVTVKTQNVTESALSRYDNRIYTWIDSFDSSIRPHLEIGGDYGTKWIVNATVIAEYASETINITDAKIALSKNAFTYNGKIQKPIVTLSNGAVLTEGVQYTLKWSNASPKNAGTYTITVTGSGAYVGTVKVTFKINKAANPLKVKAKTAKVKFSKLKKKAQKLKVTKVVKFTKKGQGTLTYKKAKGNKKITINKKNGKVTIKKGLKKGTYKVKVKIKAKGNANYKASAFKTVTFKIKVK